MDSQGRLFVADRANSRIQIFDQDGKFLDGMEAVRPAQRHLHRQERHDLRGRFGVRRRPRNPGWKRGIRIGSAKDGKVTAFIPDTDTDPAHANSSGAEGVVADAQGNVYGAEVGPKDVKKYARD